MSQTDLLLDIHTYYILMKKGMIVILSIVDRLKSICIRNAK